jgi:hypothetical protein
MQARRLVQIGEGKTCNAQRVMRRGNGHRSTEGTMKGFRVRWIGPLIHGTRTVSVSQTIVQIEDRAGLRAALRSLFPCLLD